MADRISTEHRSWNMSRIGARNTKPERIIRSYLHRSGIRFRLYSKKLPGTPDLVLAKFKTVIFVNGCFWHGHNCKGFKWPRQNREIWRKKINDNINRDKRNYMLLNDLNWRVLTVWECAVRDKKAVDIEDCINRILSWLYSNAAEGNIPGK